ncbi:unnamed protein product [Sphagnum jensenii]
MIADSRFFSDSRALRYIIDYFERKKINLQQLQKIAGYKFSVASKLKLRVFRTNRNRSEWYRCGQQLDVEGLDFASFAVQFDKGAFIWRSLRLRSDTTQGGENPPATSNMLCKRMRRHRGIDTRSHPSLCWRQ